MHYTRSLVRAPRALHSTIQENELFVDYANRSGTL